MIWSCMSWEGIGELTKTEGETNSEHYHNISQNNLSMLVVNFERKTT